MILQLYGYAAAPLEAPTTEATEKRRTVQTWRAAV